MSTRAPGAAWQSDELVASYLDRRAILVPMLDVQEDLIRRLLARQGHPIARFLDLGAGDGAMSELVLAAVPGSSGVLVDFSEPMLARAHVRLRGHAGRWQAVVADLSRTGWRAQLPPVRYDLVISGLAIHHLPTERKRELFGELYELLQPGGMFVNMDYVLIDGPLQGLFDEEMRAKALRAEREHGGTRSADEVDCEDDDDRPDTVEDQLAWLRDAGFGQATLHFKWAESAVFGATRPASDTPGESN